MSQQSSMMHFPSKSKSPMLTLKNTFLEYRCAEEENLHRSKSCPEFADYAYSPISTPTGVFTLGEPLFPKATAAWQLDDGTSSATTTVSDVAHNVIEFDSTPSEAGWAENSCLNSLPFPAWPPPNQCVSLPPEQGYFQGVLELHALAPQFQLPCPVVFQPEPQNFTNPYASCDLGCFRDPTHYMVQHASDSSTQASSSDRESEEPIVPVRLTTSASRRLRRKRAAERLAGLTTGDVFLESSKSHSVKESAELYEQMQFQILNGGNQGLQDTLAKMKRQVWSLSRNPAGCRLVQLALENASHHEAGELVKELSGHVLEAASSPHANYVLQKMLSHLTFASVGFVAEELIGHAGRIARSRYGCRILCRLLEFFGTRAVTLRLIDELLPECEDLCCHSFAHHVVQSVLEHGTEQHRSQVMAALMTDPLAYAQHKNASYLVERALCHCCPKDKQTLLLHLSDFDTISKLVLDQFGYYVARTVMKQQGMESMRDMVPQLEKSQEGCRLMVDLGLA